MKLELMERVGDAAPMSTLLDKDGEKRRSVELAPALHPPTVTRAERGEHTES